MSGVMVSVIVLAFNHEKYIRKTMDSLISQITDFEYEIIVHDDASIDNTAAIIKEYELAYPDIVKAIYQSENQYTKRVDIIQKWISPMIHGRYVAFCEGDDYWSDSGKLQIQFEMMECTPQCSICLHKTEIVDESGQLIGEAFPRYKKMPIGIIDKKEFLSLIVYTRTLMLLQFQISSAMIRADDYKEYLVRDFDFMNTMDVGDLPMFLYMGTVGNAFYIDKSMSCYRMNAIGNWNSKNSSVEKRKKHLEVESRGLIEFDQYSKGIIHDSILKAIEIRKFTYYREINDLKKMKTMKEYYKMISLKTKLKYHLCYYTPWLYNQIREIRIKLCKM